MGQGAHTRHADPQGVCPRFQPKRSDSSLNSASPEDGARRLTDARGGAFVSGCVNEGRRRRRGLELDVAESGRDRGHELLPEGVFRQIRGLDRNGSAGSNDVGQSRPLREFSEDD